MIHKNFSQYLTFTYRVSSLQGGLRDFCASWLRCNSLEWNSHCASQHLALHAKNRIFHPVQPPGFGIIQLPNREEALDYDAK
jgi:hypothetical protein